MSKPKYKIGRKIESVSEFEKSTCTFFKIGIKTYHRGLLESFQYRVLKNYISSGNVHEAELIESDMTKYTEIFKLKDMLENAEIPFVWKEHKDYKNGYQILYPVGGVQNICSVIEHSFSYGNEKDLLEIQGLLTAEEEEYDSVLGNLTATDVFQRILSHWEKINRIKQEANYIDTVDKLEALILDKKKFLFDQGLENKLKIKLSISEDMKDHLIDRYYMSWAVPKTPLPGTIKTFMGIEYEVGEETKVEVVEKKSKTKCRPFKSCDELIETWKNMMNKFLGVSESFIKTDLDEPTVWVKQKIDGRRRMIVGFGENFVEVGVNAKPITLERLFEMYTFFDGAPCGVKEEH